MCRHLILDLILDVDNCSNLSGSSPPLSPLPAPQSSGSYFWLHHYAPAYILQLNSLHLLQIISELDRKVFFSFIRLQELYLSLCFPFHKAFQVLKTIQDFTFLLNEVDPCVPVVIVYEGAEISTLTKTNILCRSPNIRTYQIELVLAPVSLIREWNLALLASWQASQLSLPATKF